MIEFLYIPPVLENRTIENRDVPIMLTFTCIPAPIPIRHF
jgi:hypothetical protein